MREILIHRNQKEGEAEEGMLRKGRARSTETEAEAPRAVNDQSGRADLPRDLLGGWGAAEGPASSSSSVFHSGTNKKYENTKRNRTGDRTTVDGWCGVRPGV